MLEQLKNNYFKSRNDIFDYLQMDDSSSWIPLTFNCDVFWNMYSSRIQCEDMKEYYSYRILESEINKSKDSKYTLILLQDEHGDSFHGIFDNSKMKKNV